MDARADRLDLPIYGRGEAVARNQPVEREASPHGGRMPSTGGFHGREENLWCFAHALLACALGSSTAPCCNHVARRRDASDRRRRQGAAQCRTVIETGALA
jgi:hypothetical protein